MTSAVEAAERVAYNATGGVGARSPPRRAVITHAVAANAATAVVVTVPTWQPNEGDAFLKLAEGVGSADSIAAVDGTLSLSA